MADIQMPQLGETVTEGTITKWFKAVGDTVAEDEPLFEVSTDKVDSEVPSPVSGTLTEILVAEGDTVDVGAVLARVGDAPAGGGDAGTAEQAPGRGPAAEPARRGGTGRRGPAAEAPPHRPSPRPRGRGPQPSSRPRRPSGAGPRTGTGAAAPAPAPGLPRRTAAACCSPVVRRLINENNLDPAAIAGTGPGGRITRNDVLAVLDKGGAQAPAAPAQPAARRAAAAPARGPRPPAAQPAAPAPPRPPLRSRWRGPASATPRSRTPTSAAARPST